MISNLITGDWFIIENNSMYEQEIMASCKGIPIGKAENWFEGFKEKYPEKKLQLLLVVSK